MNEIFEELENLSDNGIYKKDKIEWWLLKFEEEYNNQFNLLEAEKINFTHPRNLSKYKEEAQFLDTYEMLLKVADFYRNEIYFKEQVELYHSIEDSKVQLESWLERNKLVEGKRYKEFVSLFQNTTKLSGYELVIRYPLSLPLSITLEEADFKYTLQLLKILERSSKVQIIGTVNKINDMEVFEKKITKTANGESYRRAFTRHNIIISTDDGYGNELLIKFMDDRTHLLNSLKKGHKIKVYADLTGGKNESEKLGYSLSLLGWDIEILK